MEPLPYLVCAVERGGQMGGGAPYNMGTPVHENRFSRLGSPFYISQFYVLFIGVCVRRDDDFGAAPTGRLSL